MTDLAPAQHQRSTSAAPTPCSTSTVLHRAAPAPCSTVQHQHRAAPCSTSTVQHQHRAAPAPCSTVQGGRGGRRGGQDRPTAITPSHPVGAPGRADPLRDGYTSEKEAGTRSGYEKRPSLSYPLELVRRRRRATRARLASAAEPPPPPARSGFCVPTPSTTPQSPSTHTPFFPNPRPSGVATIPSAKADSPVYPPRRSQKKGDCGVVRGVGCQK